MLRLLEGFFISAKSLPLSLQHFITDDGQPGAQKTAENAQQVRT